MMVLPVELTGRLPHSNWLLKLLSGRSLPPSVGLKTALEHAGAVFVPPSLTTTFTQLASGSNWSASRSEASGTAASHCRSVTGGVVVTPVPGWGSQYARIVESSTTP